ncbi:putative membrane protein, partial [Clostridioides difficile CD175]
MGIILAFQETFLYIVFYIIYSLIKKIDINLKAI